MIAVGDAAGQLAVADDPDVGEVHIDRGATALATTRRVGRDQDAIAGVDELVRFELQVIECVIQLGPPATYRVAADEDIGARKVCKISEFNLGVKEFEDAIDFAFVKSAGINCASASPRNRLNAGSTMTASSTNPSKAGR